MLYGFQRFIAGVSFFLSGICVLFLNDYSAGTFFMTGAIYMKLTSWETKKEQEQEEADDEADCKLHEKQKEKMGV